MVDDAITALFEIVAEVANGKMQLSVTWTEGFSIHGGIFEKSKFASFAYDFPPNESSNLCLKMTSHTI